MHDDLAKFIQALKTFSRINCATCSNRNIFVEFGKIKISKFRREGFSLVTYSYLRNFILSIIKTFFSSRDRSRNTHVSIEGGIPGGVSVHRDLDPSLSATLFLRSRLGGTSFIVLIQIHSAWNEENKSVVDA